MNKKHKWSYSAYIGQSCEKCGLIPETREERAGDCTKWWAFWKDYNTMTKGMLLFSLSIMIPTSFLMMFIITTNQVVPLLIKLGFNGAFLILLIGMISLVKEIIKI